MTETSIEIPKIGVCTLQEIPVDDDAIQFQLHYLDEVVGLTQLMPDDWGRGPDGREIETVTVEDSFRGKGAGTFLVGRAITFARTSGMRTVRTCAVNERTVSAFCQNFVQNQLEFSRKPQLDEEPKPLNITKQGAIDYLARMRAEQFPDDPNSDEALQGFGIHIVGRLI